MSGRPTIYNFDNKETEVRKVICPNKSYKFISEGLPIAKGRVSGFTTGVDGKGEEMYLDPNHTHFILVNDGATNQSNCAVELRLRLENKLDTIWENCASTTDIF